MTILNWWLDRFPRYEFLVEYFLFLIPMVIHLPRRKHFFSAVASHAGDKLFSFQTVEHHLGVNPAALYPQIFDFIQSGDRGHDVML